jgi:hypothetical protein
MKGLAHFKWGVENLVNKVMKSFMLSAIMLRIFVFFSSFSVSQYNWDLSINWVTLHIDGIINARQISQKAEVDLEMVRACLPVLKHDGAIALVDMFFYSNRYECTEKAASMSAGKERKLLQEAVEFVIKRSGAYGTAPAG